LTLARPAFTLSSPKNITYFAFVWAAIFNCRLKLVFGPRRIISYPRANASFCEEYTWHGAYFVTVLE
jgi:hypothetical protein